MADTEMVKIYVMGKMYEVPDGFTIMKALEYAGYQFIRGCGCRGGFCGACGTVYRTPGDYRIKVGLACQKIVEDGMYLTQIPFYPANRASYNLEELTPTLGTLLKLYPEMSRCLGCNTCTKICPQEINVMDYMNAAMRGDIAKVAHMSFDCIMCGLCASRCPAETVQYNIGILCRRLYASHMVPRAAHLQKRVEEILAGKFDEELAKLVQMGREEWQQLYDGREFEPN